MAAGTADAIYRQVIEVEGTQAGRELEAFKRQLESMESVNAELQRQFAAVSASANQMAAQLAAARRKADEAAQKKAANEDAERARAAAELIAATERAAFEANLEAMRAAGERFEAARIKARADAQAQIDKIDADARLSAEQRAEATANIRKALEERLTAITLQETQQREKLAEREAKAQAKAAKEGGETAEKNLSRMRGILGAVGVTTSHSIGMAADVVHNLTETMVQVGPAAAVAAAGVFGLAQAYEYLQLQARRTAARDFLGIDLEVADEVAAAFGSIGAEGALALGRVAKEAKLTRGEMEALAVAAQQAARISGRSVAEEMENGLKRLGLTVSGVQQRYAEFVASLQEATPGQKLISDAQLRESEEGLARNEAAAAALREEVESLQRGFDAALAAGNRHADGLGSMLRRRLEELRGLDALIREQQAGISEALVARFNADTEALARQGIAEIERLGAGALSERERIEAEYTATLKRYAGLALADAETFDRLRVAAAAVRTKQLADLAQKERQDRLAALQAVADAERALAQERAALALGAAQHQVALLGEDASARERHAAQVAVLDQESANRRAEAAAEANSRIAALRADDRLSAEQRATAIRAVEAALQAELERINIEGASARAEAERAYLQRRREQAAAYIEWAAVQEAQLAHAVDEQAAAQIVSARQLADERIKAARKAADEGEITAEQLGAAETRIAQQTADEIARIQKDAAERAKRERLAALQEATLGLDRNQLDATLLALGMTQEAVESLRLSFVQMGADGQAAWGALGAAAELGAMAMQSATALMRQALSDWILDNQYARELAARDLQERVLQQDEAYQEITRQLATETDAKRRAALEARRAGIEERAYAKAKRQAADEASIAQQKQLAATLSALAAEAAVRALFETGMGLASLFINPAKAASHFAAAGVFAAVGGVTAGVASGLSASASRDELALAERRREQERRDQQLEQDRAARRGSALSTGAGASGMHLTIQFVGSAFVTQAEVGAAVSEALKAWEAQR